MKKLLTVLGIGCGIAFVVWIIKTMAEDIRDVRKTAKFFRGDFWMS